MPGELEKLRIISERLTDPDMAELLIHIFEELPDALVIVDRHTNIQYVNKRSELLFGYHRNELYDQPVEMLMPEAVRDRHVFHRDQYQADPHPRPMGLGMKLKARRKDATEFEAEINLSPVPSKLGPIVLAVIRPPRG